MTKNFNTRYIFFDIDGVLNGTDENGEFIDAEVHEDKVNALILIAKATNAKLVMASSWRTAWNEDGSLCKSSECNLKLHNMLKDAGCPLYSITPVLSYERGLEIKQWLTEHAKEGFSFVCLDDEKSYYINDAFFKNSFIHTAPAHCDGAWGSEDIVGLFQEHVQKAIDLFHNQESSYCH